MFLGPTISTSQTNFTTTPSQEEEGGIGNLQIWEISFICIGIILFLVTMAIIVGWFAHKNKRGNYDELDDSIKL